MDSEGNRRRWSSIHEASPAGDRGDRSDSGGGVDRGERGERGNPRGPVRRRSCAGRRGRVLGLALLVLPVLLSCGDDDSGTRPAPWNPAPIDLPLAIGSRWTYDVRDTLSGQARPIYARTDSVALERVIGGRTFSAVVSFVDGSPLDTTWWRVDGQTVELRVRFAGIGDDSLSRRLEEILESSLPWKGLDFGAPPGTSWALAGGQAEGEVNGIPVRVTMGVNAESLGRWDVFSPGGTWSDTHHGRISVNLDVTPDMAGPSTTVRIVQQLDYFVRDGVGIVRQRVQGRLEVPGEETEILYVTDAGLRSFVLP